MFSFITANSLTSFLSFLILTCQLILHFQISLANSVINSSTLAAPQGAVLSSGSTSYLDQLWKLSAGDLNGDGFQDMMVAQPINNYNNFIISGVVYVIFGSADGIPSINLINMTSSQGIRISGNPGEELGYLLSSLGDINQDGIDDIIVGGFYPQCYVIFGRSQNDGGLSDIDLSNTSLSSTQGITIMLPSIPDYYGASGAGDFNGDGVNDFMISNIDGESEKGVVFVIFGKSAFPSVINLTDPTQLQDIFQIIGNTNDQLGAYLSPAGDVNKDGIDDIIIGSYASVCSDDSSYDCGSAVVIYGTKSPGSVLDTSKLSLDDGFKIFGTSQAWIRSVASVGDVNNDGADDIAVGAPYFSPSATIDSAGIVFVIFGKAGGLTQNIDLSLPFEGFTITNNVSYGYLGIFTTLSSGDINGDGFSDLTVSAIMASGLSNAPPGVSYIIFGNKNGLTDIDLSNQGSSQLPQVLKVSGEISGFYFVQSVNLASDYNADGVNDIAIASFYKAYAIYGTECGNITECSSPSLNPICYVSKGCVCRESNLYFQETECVTDCSQGYYLNDPTCETCPDPCLTCTSDSVCQTCKDGFVLKGTFCEPACPTGYHLEDSICQSDDVSGLSEIESINAITGVTTVVGPTTLAVASAIAPNDPGSATASMLTKMLQYIKYINLPYSTRLENTFQFQNSTDGPFGLGPKMPVKLELELPFHEIPYRFSKFHVVSSFMINFWDSLIFLSIIFGVFFLIVLIEWSLTKMKRKPKKLYLVKTLRMTIQSFSVLQFYNVFGDVVLFVSLDWKILNLDNADAGISFGLSILFVAVGGLILTTHIYILLRFYRLRRTDTWQSQIEEFSKQYEALGALFKHFKNNTSISQSFLFVFVIRNCLFNLILVIFYDNPLLQTALSVTMSGLMLLYLILQRPFSTMVNLAQNITCEIILLIVNICILIIAQIDFGSEASYQLRDNLCEVVIYTSLVFNFIPEGFLILKVVVAVSQWHKVPPKKSSSSLDSKKLEELKIKKRPQNASQFVTYQNRPVDDSSVEIAMVSNISNLSVDPNNSSFIDFQHKTTPSIQLKIKETRLLDNQIKTLQRDYPRYSRNPTEKLKEYVHQQLNIKTMEILRLREARNQAKK